MLIGARQEREIDIYIYIVCVNHSLPSLILWTFLTTVNYMQDLTLHKN